MVDRCQRWNFQDGARKDRPSECHLYSQRQDVGRAFKWNTWRQVGLLHRPLENSRQSKRREKARRNFSLEFRFETEPDIRRGIGDGASIGAEEIEFPPYRAADSANDSKRLDAGILDQQSDAVLAVLHYSVVQLQFSLRRHDVVRAETFVNK